MKIGILYGYQMSDVMKKSERIRVHTPYGEIIVYFSTLGNHELLFIQRHGEKANLPPHRINYRGNIQALASCHVSCVFSVGTVGSMKSAIHPGDLVIPHDFIDATKSRPLTFFEEQRVHVDMTEPFCPSLRKILLKCCKKINNITVHDKGVYLVTEGPRLETAAEIKLYSRVADIVGMTMVPEVVLAREKGMCFASVCLVCNKTAGLQKKLPVDEIVSVYKNKEPLISKVMQQVIWSLNEKQACDCPSEVSKAVV
ncbi:hypothetical protein AYK25_00435 [Thermoplasmatales archaeon SM1-50]|nr:MAG: hypothetical protein AYK25_00435 [Thermoplasmatales archaeon SM1-50]